MNQLAGETSPYLLQHAANPVDWHPWNAGTLERARSENKPILLSIGYSACHWCHVMAHESFEDPATAALMNRLFINIKVDREERPDLDRIYQTAHHMITQRPGGWPLTMFLTPDEQLPFFAGTYFPSDARYGMPAFSDVLERVAAYYHANTAETQSQGQQIRAALAQLEPAQLAAADALDRAPLDDFRQVIAKQFDREHGGRIRARGELQTPPKGVQRAVGEPQQATVTELVEGVVGHRYSSATALQITCMTLSVMMSSQTANQPGLSGPYPVIWHSLQS